jgi:hypothetical protein
MLLTPGTQADPLSNLPSIHTRPADTTFELTTEPEAVLLGEVFAQVVVDSGGRGKTRTWSRHQGLETLSVLLEHGSRRGLLTPDPAGQSGADYRAPECKLLLDANLEHSRCGASQRD